MQQKKSDLITIPELETRENLLWFYVPVFVSLVMVLLIWQFNINVELFYAINGICGFTGTKIWQIFTLLGDGMISALLIAFWIKKRPEMAWSFIISTVVYMILLNLMKDGFDMKRPPAILDPDTFYLAGKAYMRRSFPSGHTTTIFTLCGVISFYYRSFKFRAVALLVALLVGFSRVLIGVHWPADVFGGAMLGWFSAGIGIYLAKRSKWGYHRIIKYALSIVFVIAAGVLVIKYETGYKDVVFAQKLLGFTILFYLPFTYFLRDRIGEMVN